MAELPRWSLRNAEQLKKPRLIRIDLRRSLKMHRWLALGVALAGAALAGVYLLVFWPNAAEQTHITSLILDAGLIVLAGVVLGTAAASAAHNMDPRVYVAADLERVLGIAPLAQIPDFEEVQGEIADAHTAALAREIAQACGEGSVRRCVFTGTGLGAGVSTIAARIKESLKSTGREVMLLDAAWSTPGVGPGAFDAADESGSRSDSLILTDTSPVAVSPDTEFLARFADCVIVVAESGVTTHKELKATERCLKRLNVAAIGFVVNRVRQEQSGSALRELVKARQSSVDESAGMRKQFTAAVQRALADAPSSDRVPESLRGKEPAKPFTRTTALTLATPPTDRNPWSEPGVPPWLADALGKLEAGAPQVADESTMLAEVTTPADEDANTAKPAASRNREPVTGQVASDVHSDGIASQEERSGAMLFEMNWRAPQPEAASEHERGDAAASIAAGLSGRKPSRLSALRGKVSAADLKALNHLTLTSGSLPSDLPPALVEALTDAPERLEGLRGLVTPADLHALSQARTPMAGAAETSGQPPAATSASEVAAEAETPIPIPEVGQRVGVVEAETSEVSSQAQAGPDAASSTPSSGELYEQHAAYGEVQILPSKRGQYRMK